MAIVERGTYRQKKEEKKERKKEMIYKNKAEWKNIKYKVVCKTTTKKGDNEVTISQPLGEYDKNMVVDTFEYLEADGFNGYKTAEGYYYTKEEQVSEDTTMRKTVYFLQRITVAD